LLYKKASRQQPGVDLDSIPIGRVAHPAIINITAVIISAAIFLKFWNPLENK